MSTPIQLDDHVIEQKVAGFIVANFLFGDSAKLPGPEESLIESGVVDSTGILELIEYLESEFGIEVKEEETIPTNLDGLSVLVKFITRKMEATR